MGNGHVTTMYIKSHVTWGLSINPYQCTVSDLKIPVILRLHLIVLSFKIKLEKSIFPVKKRIKIIPPQPLI